MPKWRTFKGTITQHHTSIGRCARAITLRQLTKLMIRAQPEIVVENEQPMVVWNMPIHTDGEIVAN